MYFSYIRFLFASCVRIACPYFDATSLERSVKRLELSQLLQCCFNKSDAAMTQECYKFDDARL